MPLAGKERALEFASGNMKDNVTVVLAAVGKNGCTLQFVSENMKDNERVVLAAVGKNVRVRRFASEKVET